MKHASSIIFYIVVPDKNIYRLSDSLLIIEIILKLASLVFCPRTCNYIANVLAKAAVVKPYCLCISSPTLKGVSQITLFN